MCLPVQTKWDYRQVYITLPKYGCVGRLGVALRLIVAVAIFCYIVVQHIILEGGYAHPLEGGQSYIFPKLRGFFLTNFTRDQLDDIPETHWDLINNTFWDAKDNIFKTRPNMDNSFIPTNVIITPNQTRGNCPDWPNNVTRCKPDKEGKDPTTCRYEKFSAEPYIKLKQHVGASGVQTGRCKRFNTTQASVNTTEKEEYTCEYYGWCPPPRPPKLKPKVPIFGQTKDFLLQIQHKAVFPSYNLEMTNNHTDAQCLFNSSDAEEQNKYCRNFLVKDLVNITGSNFTELAVHGAVIGIEIIWECFFILKPFGLNLTWTPNNPCLPTYKIVLVDPEVDGNGMGYYPGWYIVDDYYRKMGKNGREYERTLYHLFGLEVEYKVSYKVSYFDPISTILLLMAGTGTWATFEGIFWLIWAYACNIQNFDRTKYEKMTWEECDVMQVPRRRCTSVLS